MGPRKRSGPHVVMTTKGLLLSNVQWRVWSGKQFSSNLSEAKIYPTWVAARGDISARGMRLFGERLKIKTVGEWERIRIQETIRGAPGC